MRPRRPTGPESAAAVPNSGPSLACDALRRRPGGEPAQAFQRTLIAAATVKVAQPLTAGLRHQRKSWGR